jgi:hypothetical protein
LHCNDFGNFACGSPYGGDVAACLTCCHADDERRQRRGRTSDVVRNVFSEVKDEVAVDGVDVDTEGRARRTQKVIQDVHVTISSARRRSSGVSQSTEAATSDSRA